MSNDLMRQRLREERLVDESGLRAAEERIASSGEDLLSACYAL